MTTLDPAGRGWPVGPERPLYDREELYAGTAAEAIRLNTGIPLSAFRYMPYASGSLLVSLAAVPCYALLGPTYLAFKIIPLLVTISGGLVWLLLVRHWFGRRMALSFGLLYILAPAVLVRTALIAKGDHPEAMMLIGLSLLLATQATKRTESPSAPFWAAATGLVVGLGVYVTYSTVPVTAGVLTAGLILTQARPRILWLAGVIGLAVGLIPWVTTMALTHGAALRVYGRALGSTLPITIALERFGGLLTRGFAAGYDLPGGLPVRVLAAYTWLVTVLFGWVLLLRSSRKSRAVLLLMAGTASHFIAFGFTAPDASSRYLIPGYPLLLIAAAYPLSTPATRQSRAFSWKRIPCVLALLFGLASQATVVGASSYPSIHSAMKGTDWPLFGEVLGQKLTPEGIDLFPVELRGYLYRGQGEWAYLVVSQDEWPKMAARAGPDSASFWEGIGVAWLGRWRPGLIGARLRAMPAERQRAVLDGMALHLDNALAPLVVRAPQLVQPLMSELSALEHPGITSSFARTLGVLSTQGVILPEDAIHLGEGIIGTSDRLRGLGWALYRGGGKSSVGMRLWQSPSRLQSSESRLLPDNSAPVAFFEGMASAFSWDLSRRSDRSLVDPLTGIAPLMTEISSLTDGLDSVRAATFYLNAGSVLATIASGPTTQLGDQIARQVNRVPSQYRIPFLEGLGQ